MVKFYLKIIRTKLINFKDVEYNFTKITESLWGSFRYENSI